jgi:steroid 5-alpha reductase family enzyme
VRQAYWILFTSSHYFPADASLFVVGTLLAAHALTASPYPTLGSFTDCIGWKQWAGLALFGVGIVMEMVAEEGRRAFKRDARNRGKIDDTGLWCVALEFKAGLNFAADLVLL